MQIRKYILLIALFVFGNLSVGFTQNTISIEASKDTYINTVIADQVQGHVQSLIAAGWTYGGSYGQGRSLLGFELCPLPQGFQLVNATLHLHYDYSSGHAGHTANGNNAARLYLINSPWTENTTWSSQPTYDASTYASLPASNTTSEDYTVDVTNVVNAAISQGNEVGFYFRLDDESYYQSLVFASSEHADSSIHPILEITYFSDSSWCDAPSSPGPGTGGSTPPITDDTTVLCFEQIEVPNVFTPNADSFNDYFFIEHKCPFDTFKFIICNRWGEIVFESTDPDFKWNGNHYQSGKALHQGTYFYRFDYDQGFGLKQKSGFVEILN